MKTIQTKSLLAYKCNQSDTCRHINGVDECGNPYRMECSHSKPHEFDSWKCNDKKCGGICVETKPKKEGGK